MNIDLIRLKNNLQEYIEIDESCTFDEDFLNQTSLLGLKATTVTGQITKNSLEELEIFLNIKGTMIIPCAVSLKEVEYPFDIEVNGNLEKIMQETDENDKKINNNIDILPIICENILMEIPIKVVSEDLSTIKKEGNGWRLITEDEI